MEQNLTAILLFMTFAKKEKASLLLGKSNMIIIVLIKNYYNSKSNDGQYPDFCPWVCQPIIFGALDKSLLRVLIF